MRAPNGIICIVAVAASVVAGIGFASGDKPSQPADPKEHDFGVKVLVVQTRPKDGRGEPTSVILQKAKIRRLADQYFVVGSAPDMGPTFRLYNGAVIWTPLSEVTQIIEHDSLDKVKKIYAFQKAD